MLLLINRNLALYEKYPYFYNRNITNIQTRSIPNFDRPTSRISTKLFRRCIGIQNRRRIQPAARVNYHFFVSVFTSLSITFRTNTNDIYPSLREYSANKFFIREKLRERPFFNIPPCRSQRKIRPTVNALKERTTDKRTRVCKTKTSFFKVGRILSARNKRVISSGLSRV